MIFGLLTKNNIVDNNFKTYLENLEGIEQLLFFVFFKIAINICKKCLENIKVVVIRNYHICSGWVK